MFQSWNRGEPGPPIHAGADHHLVAPQALGLASGPSLPGLPQADLDLVLLCGRTQGRHGTWGGEGWCDKVNWCAQTGVGAACSRCVLGWL